LRPQVIYCHSGVRAGRAEVVLRNSGFTDVIDAAGYDIPEGNHEQLEQLCTCTDFCVGNLPETIRAVARSPANDWGLLVPPARARTSNSVYPI
jgi:rhodanese-related sulfurtransferase